MWSWRGLEWCCEELLLRKAVAGGLSLSNRHLSRWVMEVSCEWSDCTSRFTDVNDLPIHCRKHISDFYPMPCDAYLQQAAALRDPDDLVPGSVNLACLWKDCDFSATSTLELALHVAFHPHHCILKVLGAAYQAKHGLNACSLSSDTRSIIPDVPSPYRCCWQDCGQEFKEPILFYRHVKDHITATPRVVRPENEPGCRRYVQCSWEGSVDIMHVAC